MSKKTFSGGLGALLDGGKASTPTESTTPAKRGRATSAASAKEKETETSTSQKGLKGGDTRATFILTEASLEKLKAIAYWERLTIKEVMQPAVDEYIARYEKKQGKEVPAIPKRK